MIPQLAHKPSTNRTIMFVNNIDYAFIRCILIYQLAGKLPPAILMHNVLFIIFMAVNENENVDGKREGEKDMRDNLCARPPGVWSAAGRMQSIANAKQGSLFLSGPVESWFSVSRMSHISFIVILNG